MSLSLREQLLKAGLGTKKQANEADRERQRKDRQPVSKKGQKPQAAPVHPSQVALSQKIARDQELNRQQREKAERKARLAQVRQLIEQNRLPPIEGQQSYNFTDGKSVRRIGVDAPARSRILRGEIVIVGHAGIYNLIPAATAERIRERDPSIFIFSAVAGGESPHDDNYKDFSVPDDLMW